MFVSKYVENKINKFEVGMIFKVEDLYKKNVSKQAVSMALSRMVEANEIKRIQNGIYFKPENSRFGEVPVASAEIVKSFLYEKNKPVGYVTGNNLYNKLGLTTQISNETIIATNQKKKPKKIGVTNIKFVYTDAKIIKENIFALEILDALKNINKIFDTNADEVYKLLKIRIGDLSREEQNLLFKLAQKYYSIGTQVLVASILESFNKVDVSELKKNLNPTTTFKYKINISNKKEWRIK